MHVNVNVLKGGAVITVKLVLFVPLQQMEKNVRMGENRSEQLEAVNVNVLAATLVQTVKLLGNVPLLPMEMPVRMIAHLLEMFHKLMAIVLVHVKPDGLVQIVRIMITTVQITVS